MVSGRLLISKRWLLLLVYSVLGPILFTIAWGPLGLRGAIVQWSRMLAPYLLLFFLIALGYSLVRVRVRRAEMVWDRMQILRAACTLLLAAGMTLDYLALVFPEPPLPPWVAPLLIFTGFALYFVMLTLPSEKEKG
jgi:hypothetical protein